MPWSDPDLVRRTVALREAARAVDAPWQHPVTVADLVGDLRWGWDGEPSEVCLLVQDGADVAAGWYETSSYDNLHLAWLGVEVQPDHRRRGHGSQLLEALIARARDEGRTSIGLSGWDAPAPAAFAKRHGFEQRAVEVQRRQWPGSVDRPALDRLWEETRPHAAAYDLERRVGFTPEDELEEVAVMVAAINDAPTDDLDIEDEVFTPDRVRGYEEAQAGRGRRAHFVMARHRETRELAGETTVVVEGDRPQIAHQHDTSVVRAHRGHRLGTVLKLDMLRWLHETQPQIETIDTWNAESNDHMIEVNDLLGYRVVGRQLSFQRSV